jgi:polyhydroxyalkanoate synthase
MPPARVVRETVGNSVPGSYLALVSVSATPRAFIWQPLSDLPASLLDTLRAAIHTRVIGWTLEEFPLPGRLFEETVDLLYGQDRALNACIGRAKSQFEKSRAGRA